VNRYTIVPVIVGLCFVAATFGLIVGSLIAKGLGL
jgi:hypothetical protein